MDYDFLQQLEALGFTARIKRLSEAFSSGIRDYYKSQGLDIEPSWHLVFLWLKTEEFATMTEMANAFHYSQPAMTKLLNRMKLKGYIEETIDQQDRRRKLIRLTRKSKQFLPRFEQIWDAGKTAMDKLLTDIPQWNPVLAHIEKSIFNEGFKNLAERELLSKNEESQHE